MLDEALALIVEVTAQSGSYLELYDDVRDEPRFWRAHGCSSSKALAQVLNEASHAAPLDVDVLITGQQGIGKSALAMAIAPECGR